MHVDTHIPFAFDRRLLLADLIGEHPWVYDLPTGILSFGDLFQWQSEVLDTESEETQTWLWAWANDASPVGRVSPRNPAIAGSCPSLASMDVPVPAINLYYPDRRSCSLWTVGATLTGMRNPSIDRLAGEAPPAGAP